MNVLLDFRPLQNNYANNGIGTFIRNVYSRLLTEQRGFDFVCVGDKKYPYPDDLPLIPLIRPKSFDWFWEQFLWPLDMRRLEIDIFFSPVSLGIIRESAFPYFCPAQGIATIYDLNCLRIPEYACHSKTRSFRIQKAAIRKAKAIITLSSFVKDEICRVLEISPEKVWVVGAGIDDEIRQVYRSFRYTEPLYPYPFILTMGESPQKNVDFTIRIYTALRSRGFPGKLHIAARKEHCPEKVQQAYESSAYKKDIIFLGTITTDQLVRNYQECTLFLFPSSAEGFGFPPLEAMYCGAPVLTSNETALSETTGTGAVKADLSSPDSFIEKAHALIANREYNERVRIECKTYADSLSWRTTINRIFSVFEHVVLS